jgi:hypothetical protein
VEHRRRRHHLSALSALLFAACGSAASVIEAPTYKDRVLARIERSRSLQSYAVRHNPTDCACSPFEILVGEGESPEDGPTYAPAWHRVELIGVEESDPLIAAVREHLARVETSGQPDRRRFMMEGRLESRVGTCARGTVLLSFTPTGLLENAL